MIIHKNNCEVGKRIGKKKKNQSWSVSKPKNSMEKNFKLILTESGDLFFNSIHV